MHTFRAVADNDEHYKHPDADLIWDLARRAQVTYVSELAALAGISASTLNRKVSGKDTSRLKKVTIEKIEQAIAAKFNSATNGLDDSAMAEVTKLPQESHRLIGADALPYRDLKDFRDLPKDVPIYGMAAGAVAGAIQVHYEGEPIDTALRPHSLMGTKDVYGLYVENDSMWPKYEPGELIYVHPNRPAQIGDYVVVMVKYAEHDEMQVFLKRLSRRTATKYVLEQFNPPCTFDIKKSHVQDVHRVLQPNELLLGF